MSSDDQENSNYTVVSDNPEYRERMATYFNALSNSNRLKVLADLSVQRPQSQIAEELEMSASGVNKHKEKLEEGELVYRPSEEGVRVAVTPLGQYALEDAESIQDVVTTYKLLDETEEEFRSQFDNLRQDLDETISHAVNTAVWENVWGDVKSHLGVDSLSYEPEVYNKEETNQRASQEIEDQRTVASRPDSLVSDNDQVRRVDELTELAHALDKPEKIRTLDLLSQGKSLREIASTSNSSGSSIYNYKDIFQDNGWVEGRNEDWELTQEGEFVHGLIIGMGEAYEEFLYSQAREMAEETEGIDPDEFDEDALIDLLLDN